MGCGPCSSTIATYGATSSHARTNASSDSGSPSTEIRSVIDSRWGLVKRPVRRPAARSRSSSMREVLVLPLVPVRCTDAVGPLRVAEELHGGLDPLQGRVEPGLRPPLQQGALDLLVRRSDGRRPEVGGSVIG